MKRQVFTDMLLVRIAEGYPLADRRYITRAHSNDICFKCYNSKCKFFS